MLNKNEWDLETVSEYSKVLIDGPLNAKSNTVPDGIRYHIIELYLEELEKVVDPAQSGEVPSAHLLEPMFELLGHTVNGKVFKKVAEEVFEAILRKTAAAEGEDSDFEEENDDELSVFDKPEVDENLDDEDEEDEDEDDEEAAAEAEAEAEAEMELDGEDAEEQEPTGFDYDLLGIKERLFAVGANKETVDQNRRKVYALYKAYQDFCPLEEDEGASDEEVEEEA